MRMGIEWFCLAEISRNTGLAWLVGLGKLSIDPGLQRRVIAYLCDTVVYICTRLRLSFYFGPWPSVRLG